MTLPAAIARRLPNDLGIGRIEAVHTVEGGCIHQAVRLDSTSGPVFCKWSEGAAGRGFGAEARGLTALRMAAGDEGVVVPEVLGWSDASDDEPGWIALTYLPPSTPGPDYDERLGRGLAMLHAPVGDSWGWPEDTLIGSLRQSNPARDTWSEFWADARLGPQIDLAVEHGLVGGPDRRLFERVAAEAGGLLDRVEDDGPSLVHGDLWAGNVHAGPDGRPVLIDPAAYRGHREVDLAMADLFGGLSKRALAAYREAAPLVAGAPDRRPLYQLYYLLVHLNLFGPSYLEPCRRAARACRAEP